MKKNGRTMVLGLLFLSTMVLMISSCSFDSCGVHVGPLYGQEIKIKLKDLKIDTSLVIPDGKLVFAHSKVETIRKDKSPLILVKLDKEDNMIWALQLETKTESDIELNEIAEVNLITDKNGKRITFFNLSHAEPGTIYLKDNFDFDYLCICAY